MGGIILALVRRDLGSHHESRLPGAGPFRKIEGGRGRYPSLSFPSFVLSFPRPPLGRFVRIITASLRRRQRQKEKEDLPSYFVLTATNGRRRTEEEEEEGHSDCCLCRS